MLRFPRVPYQSVGLQTSLNKGSCNT